MVRTLITRDLAQPAGAEFDASVDRLANGTVDPELGAIVTSTNPIPIRRLGPSADPAQDGWSYVLSSQISGTNAYHNYDSTAIGRGLMTSAWWWINNIDDPTAGHFWRILSYFTGFSASTPEMALAVSEGTIKAQYRGTNQAPGIALPLKQWVEIAAGFHRPLGGTQDQYKFWSGYRLEGQSDWTLIDEFNGAETASGIFPNVNQVRGGAWPNSTNPILTRYGGFSVYTIEDIADANSTVDDTIGPPVKMRRHWSIDSVTGSDNNEGTQERPWASVAKANTEMSQLGLLPTTLDRTAVDAALATIRDAPTTADHAANDAALESALDAMYLPADVMHIGSADFGDDALWVRTNGVVVTADGGSPVLRKTLSAASWTPHATHADVYQISDINALDTVVWEDDKWMARTGFDTDDSTSIANLAAGPNSAFYIHSNGGTVYIKVDADPNTSGRVYTRSRKRATSGEGTSAILVGASNIQVRDMTLSGTALADSVTADGIQAYCVQWQSGAGGICEARDITADKGSKHTLGSTGTLANSAFLRRRVSYGPASAYMPSQTLDVDFSSGDGSVAYYYGCTAIQGINGVIGQVDGDPLVAGNFYTAHGTPSAWAKFINCDLGRGTFFGQGTWSQGVTFVDVISGGGQWAEPLTVDRCRADWEPFGVWSGVGPLILTNSIIVARTGQSDYGLTNLSGDATIQGCTIDARESTSNETGPTIAIWDCENKSGNVDFHGNLFITTKGFGIVGRFLNKTISSNYTVFMYENTVRLATGIGDLGSDFDTLAEWRARGHDLNSELTNNTFGLKLLTDYQPGPLSPLDEFTPVDVVSSVAGTFDYNNLTRPTSGGITTGAIEAMFPETNISPVQAGGKITVYRMRDYNVADGNAIAFTNEQGTWPDLTGATVQLLIAMPGKRKASYSITGQVSVPNGPGQTVYFEPTAEQLSIDANDYAIEVVATQAYGDKHTLADGNLSVLLGREAPI